MVTDGVIMVTDGVTNVYIRCYQGYIRCYQVYYTMYLYHGFHRRRVAELLTLTALTLPRATADPSLMKSLQIRRSAVRRMRRYSRS